jgi:hypothetical protein
MQQFRYENSRLHAALTTNVLLDDGSEALLNILPPSTSVAVGRLYGSGGA